jgi:AcrR family transcriptional regulator
MARTRVPDNELDRRESTVDRILRTAVRCLARKDSDSLSMREIAEEAGVSKALLHYHFKSKDDLLLAALDDFFQKIVTRVQSVTSRLVAEGGNVDALMGSFDAIWAELRASGNVPAVVLRLSARGTTDRAIRRRLILFRKKLHTIAAEGLRRALGPIAEATRPLGPLADLFLSCLMGLEANRFFVEDPREMDMAFGLTKLLFKQIAVIIVAGP